MTMKDLNVISAQERQSFFDSFDYVLCDVDGVLWLDLEPIPGAINGIKCLQNMGKKIIFVSNNTMKSHDFYYNQLNSFGLNIEKDQLITPILAIISHLKKANLTKEVYVVGMAPLKTELANAGFIIAKNGPDRVAESLKDLALNTMVDKGNVGAVVADVDVNVNWARLQQAATYLKRPEVLFVTGAGEINTPVGLNQVLLGPGNFHKILEDVTGRKAVALAKPGVHLNGFILDKFQIQDRSRVVFIGDSIPVDMGFAAACGYKKLLVLSGLAKLEDVTEWTDPDEYQPDYYVNSLSAFNDTCNTLTM